MSGSCNQPGCTGTYETDGYCDECGHKAPASASVAPKAATNGTALTSGALLATGTTTRGSGPTRSTRRGRIGGGLLDLPRLPLPDPAATVLKNPQVAPEKRFCGNPECAKPVGRARNGRPGLVEGFCAECRTEFSFKPKLAPGTLVSGRYEVLGCLAYGGLGWIYLARDKNVGDEVADRWVVLKGLIDSGDPDAMAAAVSERRFLVTVDHPTIVKIHDFALHPDPRSGADVGYIVMEYVGGRSLRDIRGDRSGPSGQPAPLPLDQVIGYGLEVLPALGYLHERGLLYCDFKPDNAIHSDDRLKLVDLGAVRRMDDSNSVSWGTRGYAAPEVEKIGPSISSDLYTVARSMAVLSLDFRGFSSTYVDSLPDPAEHPVLAAHESYHRVLLRATHKEPGRRFDSAAEMSDQLLGVLRQVLSSADGVPRPAESSQFAGEGMAFATEAGAPAPFDGPAIAAALPTPQVDPADPGASFLLSTRELSREALVSAASGAPAESVEVPLALVRAHLAAGDLNAAGQLLDGLAPDDWRVAWFRGVAALAGGDPRAAVTHFDDVYGVLPGELAPQLALAVASEWAGQPDPALARYLRVWNSDHRFVSAAFGIARILLARREPAAATEILEAVPASSSHHLDAQLGAVWAQLAAPPSAPVYRSVSARLERLKLAPELKAKLSIEVLSAALRWVRSGGGSPNDRVLGVMLTERDLRFGLERSYRALAKLDPDLRRRIVLVDEANRIRPRTLV